MAVFGVRTTPEIDNFMKGCHDRIKRGVFFFEGNIKALPTKEAYSYYLIDLRPVVPPFYWVGVFYTGGFLYFNGFRWSFWLLPGLFIASTSILYSATFYINMLRLGLRQNKIKQKIQYINKKDLLEYIANTI